MSAAESITASLAGRRLRKDLLAALGFALAAALKVGKSLTRPANYGEARDLLKRLQAQQQPAAV